MTNLDDLKNLLYSKNASLVVCYSNGEIKEYYQKRVNDIKDIFINNDHTGMCPMENRFKDEEDVEKIFQEIIG